MYDYIMHVFIYAFMHVCMNVDMYVWVQSVHVCLYV